MAVTSNATYNAATIAPSFTSSNVYYSHVPRCKKENQHKVMLGHIEIAKPSMFNCYSYDTMMETDEDGCDYSMTSDYLNNDSVIVEAAVQNRLKAHEKLQVEQQAVHDADVPQRRNRKRHNNDLNSTCQLKKFRRGADKDYVLGDTGSTKDCESTTMCYESEALNIDKNIEDSMITNKNCWTAGNYISNNSNYQELFNSENTAIESTIEYEKILFETHGCSIYQFHRLQLVGNDDTETEF